MTKAQPGSLGFMDRQLRPGDEWPSQLAQALATCRVFVPLYSPRYFDSQQCGKEWFSFARRAANFGSRHGASVEAIVPALWVGVLPSSLPEVARSIHFDHKALGVHYPTEGFYGIMKLSRYRSEYRDAVYLLARRIVEVAERTKISPAAPDEYQSLENAFLAAGTGQAAPDAERQAGQQIRITIAAPSVADLPEGRDPEYYGSTPRDWNPYHPESARPLAEHASDLARCLGYRPTVVTFDEQSIAAAGTPPAAPGLFIIDPWTAGSGRFREQLARFDRIEQPWVSVIVPCNREDRQTMAARDGLRPQLHRALQHMFDSTQPGCRGALEGVGTLDDFSRALPPALYAANQKYLSHATPYPPKGPVVEKPWLSGPGPNVTGGSS